MADHVSKMEVQQEQIPSKNSRRKRGKLLRKICQQMEFYFGDSNLAKDKFLAQRLAEDPNGYVDVDLFLKFNKIRALTQDTHDITDALISSELLEVSSDGKRLRRKKPVERTNFDDCTIYVERLPPHADHRWLRDVFTRFGNVTHTSIPHFKASGKIKGFAFVEFESPESVIKASKHFRRTSTDSGESDTGEESDDPKDKKVSGKAKKSQSHCKEHQYGKGKDGMPHRSGKKRKRNESEGSERHGCNRRSLDNEDTDGKSAKQSSEVNGTNEIVDNNRSATEPESCDDKSDVKSSGVRECLETTDPKSDPVSSHKSGKKRKRRDSESALKRVKYEQICSDSGEAAKLQAHISGSVGELKCKDEDSSEQSTREIKSEMPSESVVTMSGSAEESDQAHQSTTEAPSTMETEVSDNNCPVTKRQKKRRRKKKNKSDDDKPHLRVLTKAEWKTYRNKYLSLQRASMVHVKKMLCLETQQSHLEENEGEDNFELSPVKEQPLHEGGVKFQHGVIIKLKLSEPTEDCIKLRKQLRSLADVSYVDATEGSRDVYVRCPNPEAVSTIIAEARFSEFGDTEICNEEEETAYWKKVMADRDAKFQTKRNKKKRGRDKLITKATKILGTNTHVHFND